MESPSKQIAKLVIDAFDLDIHIYMANVLKQAKGTEAGIAFSSWAADHPSLFESLLRVFSSLIQQLPSNDNILTETIYDHLQRLPFEIWRVTTSEKPDQADVENQYKEVVSGLRDEEKFMASVVPLEDLEDLASASANNREKLINSLNNSNRKFSEVYKKIQEQRRAYTDTATNSIRAANEKMREIVPDVEDPGFFRAVVLPFFRIRKKSDK